MKRLFAIASAVVLIACGKSTTGPGTANVVGVWSGSITDAKLGQGTFALTLTQTSDSVMGTWATSFPDPSGNLDGLVRGTIGGATLSAMLEATDPTTCQYSPLYFTASVNGTGAMTGKVVTTPCSSADSATVVLARTAAAATTH
jgi:hypothetical protein